MSKGLWVKIAHFILSGINGLLIFLMMGIISGCCLVKHTWGNVSLIQLLFFAQTELQGTNSALFYRCVFCVIVLPAVLTAAIMWGIHRLRMDNQPYYPHYKLLGFLGGAFIGISLIPDLSRVTLFLVYLEFYIALWVNLNRCYRQGHILILNLLFVPIAYFISGSIGNPHLINPDLSFEKTDFYAREYKSLDKSQLKNEKKRNVIVIFGESLESRFVHNQFGDIADRDAVRFDDFTEGYAQRWTQAALFSAFTGVHIHYLSDAYRYKIYDNMEVNKATDEDGDIYSQFILANKIAEKFSFDTPKIAYLGEITAQAGYQNLFVQGGDLTFSGTSKLLLNHGFKPENIYDLNSFKENREYATAQKWWGVTDKTVFEKFKYELLRLEKDKPFFAVMFTLDLHGGNNPFMRDIVDESEHTIANFNDFIRWFKAQDFYENTTLIILADHRRMGPGVVPGGGLYNVFFNLPNADTVNKHRSFNQIDMFPTIMEIAGFDVPNHQAGMGTSLLADTRTLAERFDYHTQKKEFSKIDLFYRSLWE